MHSNENLNSHFTLKKGDKYTLGLDLGSNSLGWAVLDFEKRDFDLGTRIFPAGLNNYDSPKEKSLCAERREARGRRRLTRRKRESRKQLKAHLQKICLLPSEEKELKEIEQENPYELRANALNKKLEPYQIGRIFWHLSQRRGFLSLRKSEENKEKETKGILKEMDDLEQKIQRCETLGEYLYKEKQKDENSKNPYPDIRLRNRYLRRKLINEEFNLIWERQAKHYPKILTEKNRYGKLGKRENSLKTQETKKKAEKLSLGEFVGIQGLIFFQRNVYWDEKAIGKCQFETKESRCSKADLNFQKFRYLQQINSIRVIDNKNQERPLNKEERKIAIEEAKTKESVKFDDLRNKFGKEFKDKVNYSNEAFRFNLEESRKSFNGSETDCKCKSKKAYGKEWLEISWQDRSEIVAILAKNESDEQKKEQLSSGKWRNFKKDKIDDLLNADLSSGYGHLSEKALKKLIPYLEKGLPYQGQDEKNSAVHCAGYIRDDEKTHQQKNSLPLPSKWENFNNEVSSPVVKRSIYELRKVVNAIIKKYGNPEKIHIEMARDLKMGKKAREEYATKLKNQSEKKEKAKKTLNEWNIKPTRDAILMILLWDDQEKICPYSLNPISKTNILNSECDIDHIIPRSRGGSDDYMNKVLCFRNENKEKGNKTPYEWLSGNADRYEKICQNAKKLPYAKYRKFLMEKIPDAWQTSKLNDTQHTSRIARKYLSQIVKNPKKDIICTKGIPTFILRDQWQLNQILHYNETKNEKNREDHRHHAIDAFLIACTDRKIFKKINDLSYEELSYEKDNEGKYIYKKKYKGGQIPNPFQIKNEDFRNKVKEKINQIWISHRVNRKISGNLHKETLYSPKIEKAVARKKLDALTPDQLWKIRDKTILYSVLAHIANYSEETPNDSNQKEKERIETQNETRKKLKEIMGNEMENQKLSDGGKIEKLKEKEEFKNLIDKPLIQRSLKDPAKMNSGVPIKKVRLFENKNTIPIRKDSAKVEKDSNHHIALYRPTKEHPKEKAKVEAEVISVMEILIKRKNLKKEKKKEISPISKQLPTHYENWDKYKFWMSLSKQEAILRPPKEEETHPTLWIYNTVASTTKQMTFWNHLHPYNKKKGGIDWKPSPDTLPKDTCKVNITPLGEIRRAGD